MNIPAQQRCAGVLLHVTALPGPFAHGVLGTEILQWIDRLAESGFRVWQFLPLGPTHGHGSPYEALSSFAGNPEWIDPRLLVQWGWLAQERLDALLAGRIAMRALRQEACAGLSHAIAHDPELNREWQEFHSTAEDWLRPYACFMALREARGEEPWWQWPASLRRGDKQSLRMIEAEHAEAVQRHRFEQFAFERQWRHIRAHAEERGVTLFGDLPIYVAHDSADVWSNQSLFTLDDSGTCTHVAGVPPDYFSREGQRWGNPLYRWERMQADEFRWWRRRVAWQLRRMHWLRIDHFLGLHHYWSIPAECPDGRQGEWKPAPGRALLHTLQDDLGELPLVAEDLGLITEEVTALRRRFGLPGMKVLQFAFGGDAENPFLPHNHETSAIVYTGTHDNDTTRGWFEHAPAATQQHMRDYLACSGEDMPWPMIRAALASVAKVAIVPMQDLLALGSEARFNTPGSIDGNWRWRMMEIPDTQQRCWRLAHELHRLYGRC